MSLGSIAGWLVIGFVLVMVYRVMRDVFAYKDHEEDELGLGGVTEEVKETPKSVEPPFVEKPTKKPTKIKKTKPKAKAKKKVTKP